MARITHDCELMLQPVTDKTLTDCQDFTVVYDSNFNPVVFSISNNGRFLLIAPDVNGFNQLRDLSKKFALQPGEKVTSFAISQGDDLRLYVAFASEIEATSSHLHVVQPLVPTSGTWLEETDWPTQLCISTARTLKVHKLLLDNHVDGSNFPFLAAVISQPGELKRDVIRVSVKQTSSSAMAWDWATDLSCPFNIDDMVDFCVGRIPGASGIFGLDVTQGNPSITFAGLEGKGSGPRAPVTVRLPVISGARSLATTRDAKGRTNLIVGGDGILHLSAQDCIDSVSHGTVYPPTIMNEPLQSLRNLHVAQRGQSVTIWAQNARGQLICQRCESDESELETEGVTKLVALGPSVPLLPTGEELRCYSALVDPETQSQDFFLLMEDGSVSCMVQAGDSMLWSTQQLRIPDPEDCEDINTYTCHIHVDAENGLALAYQDVQVQTSSQRKATINGRVKNLGSWITTVTTDGNGNITIMLPANELAVPNITLTGISGVQSPYTINPAVKAVDRVAEACAKCQLGSLRRADGSLIFPATEGLGDKAKQTVDAVARLHKMYQTFSGSPNILPKATALTTQREDVGEGLWQLWQGIRAGVETVVNWAIIGVEFIITTTDKVWRWIVDSSEKALKGIEAALDWLGVKVEEILESLAAALDWSNILDTKRVLSAFANAGFDVLREALLCGGDEIDGFFQKAETEVGSWHLPPKLPEKAQSLRPTVEKAKEKQGMGLESLMTSAAYNWSSYQLEHGGVKKGMREAQPADSGLQGIFNSIWEDFIKPLWENFKDAFANLWQDLKELFKKDSPLTWKDILKNIGTDVLLGLVRGFRKATHAFFKISEQVVAWIQNLLNAPVKVWLISKLYRKLTGGDLTIIDLCTLLLAVPTSYVFKYAFGKSPQEFFQIKQILEKNDTKQRSPSGTTAVTLETQFSSAAPQRFTSETNASKVRVVAYPSRPLSGASFARTSVIPNRQGVSSRRSMHTAVSNTAPVTNSPNNALKPVIQFTYGGFAKFLASAAWEWLCDLFKLGNLIANAAKVAFSAWDSTRTLAVWPTLGAGTLSAVTNPTQGWKEGLSVTWALILAAADMPVFKWRHDGFAIRFILSCVKGAINIYKAGMPDLAKPILAGLAGAVDLVVYTKIIWEESNGKGPTDDWVEITQRWTSNGWAVGSAWCGYTAAMEIYGLTATSIIYMVMNVENTLLVLKQGRELLDNWDETKCMHFESSLGGSLS